MSVTKLYGEHLEIVRERIESGLAECAAEGKSYEGVVLHAGTALYYHADDQDMPFRPTPHFAWLAPAKGPDHLIVLEPGRKPRMVEVVPRDYWYEAPAKVEHPYRELLDWQEAQSAEGAREIVGPRAGYAYVGNDPSVAAALGIEAVEPEALMARLDWHRGAKTPYEQACIREAAKIAARGFAAVREGVGQERSERELHAAYLAATGHMENDTPYSNIVGWNQNAAVLHYQSRSTVRPAPARALLLDAGGSHLGYASDITRTWARPAAHELFTELLDRMDALERELVGGVGPGVDFVELHRQAHAGVAAIVSDLGILKVRPEEALERGLTHPFLPHGLGHHLGLQVHDVGGKQQDSRGTMKPSPPEFPALRTTRVLEPGHVVTIEPGLYFIPLLLDPQRTGEDRDAFQWSLIDELIPCGGIRIEDDILVTESGFENLTRELVPGHR